MEDRKTTVIFDFDGTLANTIDLVGRLYNDNARAFGALPVDLKELPELRKMGYKKAMKAKKIRWTNLPKIILFISREMKKHMAEVDPYPGVVPMLKRLVADGYPIGVLTSNNAGLVYDFLKAHDFPDFNFVVAEKTIFGKDKALRKIMKRHNLRTDEIVYVGDEPRDVLASKKAGIETIAVTWGVGGVDGLSPSKPRMMVDTAEQLEQAIKSFKSSD